MKDRKYTIILEPEKGGGYAVTVPAQGRTVEEAMERAAEAMLSGLGACLGTTR